MTWFTPLLIALSVFLISAILFSSAVNFFETRYLSRVRHSQVFARLRFFIGIVLFALPVFVFYKLTLPSGEKTLAETIALVVLLIAGSWVMSEFILEFLLGNIFYKRLGIPIPAILSDVIKGILYIAIAVIILHLFLHVDLKPFLTTSAIFTAIVGLAFQDTLGNVIAGLALHFSSPYQVGDWIQIGNLEGKILRLEWRSTLILTRSNDAIVVPHVSMAKNEIYNYSVPSSIHAREIKIPLDINFPPRQVEHVLREVALNTPGVLETPKPQIQLLEFDEFKILYSLWVWVNDFERLPEILSVLRQRIWYALRRESFHAGLAAKYNVILQPPEQDGKEDLLPFLSRVKVFQDLPLEKLQALCLSIKQLVYTDEEKIIREGETSQDFYLLYRGRAQAVKNNAMFHEFLPGEFFGEMALLTEEPRKATIVAKGEANVLALTKDILTPYLESHPPFLSQLSEVIAERLKTLPADELPSDIKEKTASGETFGKYVLKKIKEFFLI